MPDDTPSSPNGDWRDDRCPDPVRDALRRPVHLGRDARDRLAAALASEPRPRRSVARWFVRPMPLPPLATAAAAAALLLAGLVAGERIARARTTSPAATRATVAQSADAAHAHADTVRLVRFVLVAPRAGRVALVGDFNAWDPARTPMRATAGGGVWTVELPVGAGRHLYSFVVDGTRWVADPTAPLAPEEDFGTPNSVLVVGAET